MSRTGAQILVDQLLVHGAELAFGVPGESYLAVLDALHDAPLRFIATRHEGGAANAAEAYGKLTGRPGICLVTRGPGATQASVGVHTAFQDSTPMLLLVGQVARGALGREAFQELDYRAVFSPIAKWATQIDAADRVPEVIARAWARACTGRPGPVVVALPEDMLVEESDAEDAPPFTAVAASPGADELARLRELVAGAERPLVVVGEGGWNAQAGRDVLAWAEGSGLPVAASFRCQDYVDNDAPAYVGHAGIGMDPRLARRIADADVLIALGGRLGEIPSNGYTLLRPGAARPGLVHVHPDPDELGAVYPPALGIVSGLPEFAAATAARLEPAADPGRRARVAQARSEYEELMTPRELPGDLQLAGVMAVLRERLTADAVIASGAGNFTVWAHRFYTFREYPTQLAPRSGAMGYGVPAALAAQAVFPGRTVVCLAGDGDFLMTGQELATAVQYELPVIVLVVNNGMYGTIRMHQERHFPGRVFGTNLVNPDFAAYARAFGAHGEVVRRTDDFAPAFDAALASGGPAVLELRVDPEAITPRQTLSEIREAAS